MIPIKFSQILYAGSLWIQMFKRPLDKVAATEVALATNGTYYKWYLQGWQ